MAPRETLTRTKRGKNQRPKKAAAKSTKTKKTKKTGGTNPPADRQHGRQSRQVRPAAQAAPARPAGLAVGIHAGVAHLRYHDDPAPEASLSSSFIKRVYESSPAHAWLTHPRLTAEPIKPKASREMDFGSAAHAVVLESQEVAIIKARDFKTDQARSYRDRAKEAGQAPVLQDDFARIMAMKKKLFSGLSKTEIRGAFEAKGMNEAVAIWKEDGFFFRARADRWLSPLTLPAFPDGLILDYKTTWDAASPEKWSSVVFNIGGDFQSVLYPHGFALAQIQTGKSHAEGQPIRIPAFRYVVQECEAPFEFQVFGPSQVTIDHTTNKIVRAFEAIKGAWNEKTPPGYPRDTCLFDPPVWELKREERAALTAVALGRPA